MMASLEDVMVLIVIVAMEYILYPHLSKTMYYNFPPLHKVRSLLLRHWLINCCP